MSAPVIRPAAPARRILLFSKDPILRYTRAEVLVTFGYNVAAPGSDSESRKLIESQPFEVLILCDTADAASKLSIATVYRDSQPLGRIVEILAAPGNEPLVNPDATVVSLDGPWGLRRVIEEQFRQPS
jgi:CheY-like chemotaxis protein